MVLFALRFGIEKEQLAQGLSNLDFFFSRKRNMFAVNFVFFFGGQEDLRAKPKLHVLLYDIRIQMVGLAYLCSEICMY